jgi:hypothetical protein
VNDPLTSASKLALEILVLSPLRPAAVGTISVVLSFLLPVLGGFTPILVLDPKLGGTLTRPL